MVDRHMTFENLDPPYLTPMWRSQKWTLPSGASYDLWMFPYVNIPTDNLNNFFSDNSEPSFFITDNVTNKKIILNSRKISLNVWTLNISGFISSDVTFIDENKKQYAYIQLSHTVLGLNPKMGYTCCFTHLMILIKNNNAQNNSDNLNQKKIICASISDYSVMSEQGSAPVVYIFSYASLVSAIQSTVIHVQQSSLVNCVLIFS